MVISVAGLRSSSAVKIHMNCAAHQNTNSVALLIQLLSDFNQIAWGSAL